MAPAALKVTLVVWKFCKSYSLFRKI